MSEKRSRKDAPSATPSPERKGILHLRGSEEFDSWFEGFHSETHIPKMQLVRLGLALAAKKYGYEPAMPEI